ncbi:MAG: hypothetical protein H7Y41_04460 [Hyphomonadaceae bacterium]|nr:hypothetical protein [Clostridia bacterium]
MGAAHTRPFLKKGDKNFSWGFFIIVNKHQLRFYSIFFKKLQVSKGQRPLSSSADGEIHTLKEYFSLLLSFYDRKRK